MFLHPELVVTVPLDPGPRETVPLATGSVETVPLDPEPLGSMALDPEPVEAVPFVPKNSILVSLLEVKKNTSIFPPQRSFFYEPVSNIVSSTH